MLPLHHRWGCLGQVGAFSGTREARRRLRSGCGGTKQSLPQQQLSHFRCATASRRQFVRLHRQLCFKWVYQRHQRHNCCLRMRPLGHDTQRQLCRGKHWRQCRWESPQPSARSLPFHPSTMLRSSRVFSQCAQIPPALGARYYVLRTLQLFPFNQAHQQRRGSTSLYCVPMRRQERLQLPWWWTHESSTRRVTRASLHLG